MNVLFFSARPAPRYGGVVAWSRHLAATLSELGHQVHTLDCRVEPPGPSAAEGGRHPHPHVLRLDPRLAELPVLGFWYRHLAAARAGRRLVARYDLDVLHTVSPYEAWSASLARGSGPQAVVLSIHGDYPAEQAQFWKSRWRRRLYLPLEWAAFRGCQAVTTSSAWLQGRLSPALGPARSRAVVIPNGIALAPEPGVLAPEAAGRPEGLPDGRPVLLTLNSLYAPYRRRGLELLVAAAPAILEAVPHALFLVVGGVNDPQRDRQLVAWARDLAAGLPFHFTGYRQRPPADLMAAADLYIHPSFLDNSPTAVLEAMALARPIVATRVGGIPELIDHGRSGLLVPLEPAALAAAVVRLLLDPPYAQALAAEARRRALDHFSWAGVGRGFAAIYATALADRQAQGGPRVR